MTTLEGSATRTVDLEIGGMTCASCAARIEKRLNQGDEVRATVNYATERARAVVPAAMSTDELIAQVAAVGYTASLIPAAPARPEPVSARPDRDDDATRGLRQRVIVSRAARGAGRWCSQWSLCSSSATGNGCA